MKAKHLAITLLFFIGITTAQAQRGDLPDAKEQAKKSADEWKQEFGLSDDQHTKVYDILVASSENMRKKLGQGQVIEGWDEGIALLKVGDKARFVFHHLFG